MAADVANRPWLICVTRRGTGTDWDLDHEPHMVSIELRPLSVDATARLIETATAEEPLPSHVVRALAERSDGNPLFALELLNALRDEGSLDTLPHSVEGLISARIDRLAPDDRALLRRVSVLGGGFHERHLSALFDDDVGPPDSLVRLRDFVSVEPTGWVRFRHALVRDVAYAGLPFSTRSRLHGRIADSLVLDVAEHLSEQAALLSLHFLHAHRYGDAWQYARLAGDAANEIYANLEAVTLYQRALQAARHLPDLTASERAAVYELLGDVQDLAGLYADARTTYRAAGRLVANNPVQLARLALKDAFAAERQGHYTDAVRSTRRGLRLLDTAGADSGSGRGQTPLAVDDLARGPARRPGQAPRSGAMEPGRHRPGQGGDGRSGSPAPISSTTTHRGASASREMRNPQSAPWRSTPASATSADKRPPPTTLASTRSTSAGGTRPWRCTASRGRRASRQAIR